MEIKLKKEDALMLNILLSKFLFMFHVLTFNFEPSLIICNPAIKKNRRKKCPFCKS